MSQDRAWEAGHYGPRHLIGAMGGNWASSALWWVEPLLMRELAIGRGFGEAAAGLVLCVELAMLSLSSAALTRYVPTERLGRAAVIGIVVAIAASLVSLEATTLPLLIAARAVAGAGAGAALMMSNSVAAGFADPDRAFGKITVANILFGVVLIPSVAWLAGWFPRTPSYGVILLTLVLTLVPILAMPRTGTGSPTRQETPVAVIPWPGMRNIWLVALATFLIGMASATVWAFYAVIGDKAGLTPAGVDAAVSTAIFAGLIGAGLAALMGGRFGRLRPIACGVVAMSAAVVALSVGPTATGFRVATCVNVGALYFLLPYLLGAGSAQDASGRGAGYVGAAFFLTGALGPVVGGILAETVGLRVVGIAVLFAALSVIAIFAWLATHPVGADDDRGVLPHGAEGAETAA